jgi:formylmethanofuran:tetrahydromethanopterin formyltransferase
MEEHGNAKDGVLSLRFPREKEVPEDGVIEIVLEGVKQDTLHHAMQETPA